MRSALTAVLTITCAAFSQPEPSAPPARGRTFQHAWQIAKVAFYDPGMNGVNWDAVREELAPQAAAAPDAAAESAVINEALARLRASHTAHYHQDQREYYELLDIFWPEGVPARADSSINPGPVRYTGIGLTTRTFEGKTFADDVYDSGPAAAAGILPGDELLRVEDGPWGDIAPFRGREGMPTRILIQRTAEADSRREITVTPAAIKPRELFLAAQRASARIIEFEGRKVAYVRIRSYANPAYHDLLKELLAERLAPADALVLDLRAGWGGASPQYMDIFNPTAPSLAYTDREGKSRSFDPTWRKPVVLLIDGQSRSGKEVIAHAFKTHRLGPLVGERTAGAVLAGTPRPLADGSVLYIAVARVLVDGKTLEGVGVEPDAPIQRRLPYAEGRDGQLDAAVAAATALLKDQPKDTP